MGTTIIDRLQQTVQNYPTKIAINYKRHHQWQSLTWSDYQERIFTFAKGLISTGLQATESVVILSQNCHEWVIANLAAIAAGGVPAGIYPTSSNEQCAYIINHCQASLAIVENHDQLDKLQAIKDQLPSLKAIILIQGESSDSDVYSWNNVETKGTLISDEHLTQRLVAQQADHLATLVYTSGTTSNPKAVMLSHRNLTWTAAIICDHELNLSHEDVLLSYLPLSHIAEQMISIHGPLHSGACVWFAESIDKLPLNLKDAQPTLFVGVPRVWEKIQQRILSQSTQQGFLKQTLFKWAQRVGRTHQQRLKNNQAPSWSYGLAKKIIYNKLRHALGLTRCRIQVTSAAPISMNTLSFFTHLDIPLYELYGMSECSGPTTMSLPGQSKIGTTGRVIHGATVKIADDDEILIKGPHVFLGYLHNNDATAQTLDQNGWLHSGDLGNLDANGYLSITGRKKNLLITAGGENIAPEMLENKLKAIPGIEHIVVIGDQKKYLSALFTLSPEALNIAKQLNSPSQTPQELTQCPLFHHYIQKQLDIINQSVARVQTIKKFTILNKTFSEEKNELTPTLKIKRHTIYKHYATEIARLYS